MISFKKKILWGASIVCISIVSVNYSCKKKVEAAPVADFSVNAAPLKEGNILVITNKSTNGKRFQWAIAGLKWTSEDQNPSLFLDSAGVYTVDLKVTNGDGKTATKSMSMTVIADTVFRLTGNSKKTWMVKSITYLGSEQLTAACQLDNEFTIFKTASQSTDTCQMTEGKDTCGAGVNLIELPNTSQWRFLNGNFEFSLMVLGTPFNLSFVPTVCSKWEFVGTDSKNGVSIRFLKK